MTDDNISPRASTSPTSPKPSRATFPTVLVVVGCIAIGAIYSGIDWYFDEQMEHGEPLGTLYYAHELVDRVLPIVAGGLFGLVITFLRVRSEVAEVASERAADLDSRIRRIQRDQAAWVVAAATLHEVRNPLHSLGLALEEVGLGGEKAEEARARAHRQMERIEEHLGRLRDFVETRQPEIDVIDLGPIATIAAKDVEPTVGVEVRVDGNARAAADPSYVRIVVDNLVRNAADAVSSKKGRVLVQVADEGEHAVVRVVDDGPGIDGSVASGIFEPLRTTKERGLGLGLPIARALARAMGGDVRLDSTGPRGTAVVLELPRSP